MPDVRSCLLAGKSPCPFGHWSSSVALTGGTPLMLNRVDGGHATAGCPLQYQSWLWSNNWSDTWVVSRKVLPSHSVPNRFPLLPEQQSSASLQGMLSFVTSHAACQMRSRVLICASFAMPMHAGQAEVLMSLYGLDLTPRCVWSRNRYYGGLFPAGEDFRLRFA